VIGIGVSGSDTGVGKTVVGCAIARAFSNRKARVSVLKPVETGVDPLSPDSDAGRLLAAARSGATMAAVRPYAFRAPVAPIVAGRREGTIDQRVLDAAFANSRAQADVVIVEGAGGLLVPLTPAMDFAVLFGRWRLNVALVVPNRLGGINQALMSLRAAAHSKLTVLAVVLTDMSGGSAAACAQENARTIAESEFEVPVVEFPWLPDATDFDASASWAERCGLMDHILRRAITLA
jgi:dethiobiotin synthetase